MALNLKKDYSLKYFFIFLSVLLFSLIFCLLALSYIAKLQMQSAEDRFDSLRIGNELRQSSENLTKMVRLYVLTGNKKYRGFYNNIIDIRDGKAPRPQGYNEVYWDLTIDKPPPSAYLPPKSLTSIMIERNFTLEEFSLMEHALSKSKELTAVENKAMNLMEGVCDINNQPTKCKPNVQLAQSLVSSDAYRNQKVEIMVLIQRFFDMVYQRTYNYNHKLNKAVIEIIALSTFLAVFSTVIMIYSMLRALRSLARMYRENDVLLLNILPQNIANRLKKGEQDIADEFSQVSILFADIVNFSSLTFELGAHKIVSMLGRLFDDFDALAEMQKVEKIKTIGDSYMAVTGLPTPITEHAAIMADFALALLERVEIFNKEQGLNIKIRIGMTYGPVVAGVVGRNKFVYDVWGNVVNIASRLEATSLPSHIHLSEKMAFMLEEDFIVVEREHPVQIKGYKVAKTYFLVGRKS